MDVDLGCRPLIRQAALGDNGHQYENEVTEPGSCPARDS
jgi:hypothetical protein